MNNSVKRQLVILATMVAVAGAGLLYFSGQAPEQVQAPASDHQLTVHVIVRAGTDTLITGPYTAAGPLSVLSALEQTAARATLPVGIRQYDFGKLVVSVGGYTAGTEGDWTYRVNDALIPVAAEACQLADGDRLEFRFGKKSEDSEDGADSTI